MKPILVGESNPYQQDPDFALYPAPYGCAGHRLCVKILGMQRRVYLEVFDRVNLCAGKWSIREARSVARKYREEAAGKVILLGSKVCLAACLPFTPFLVTCNGRVLVLPHPSGLCRLWGRPGAMEQARAAVGEFLPELAHLIGAVDPQKIPSQGPESQER